MEKKAGSIGFDYTSFHYNEFDRYELHLSLIYVNNPKDKPKFPWRERGRSIGFDRTSFYY